MATQNSVAGLIPSPHPQSLKTKSLERARADDIKKRLPNVEIKPIARRR